MSAIAKNWKLGIGRARPETVGSLPLDGVRSLTDGDPVSVTTREVTPMESTIATASQIATFTDGRLPGDPLHTSETLYRQRSHWFLLRRRDGHENIIPLTPEETRKWCEQKRFDHVLVRYFGERVKRQAASLL
jgi:hypothetical protein